MQPWTSVLLHLPICSNSLDVVLNDKKALHTFLSRTFVFRSGKMSCEAPVPGVCALNFSLLVMVGSKLKNV